MKKYILLMIAATGWAGVVGGPKGGKMLESKPQRAEFWLNAGGKVEVTFYDEALKPVAPAGQTVRITAQAPDGNATLTMKKNEESFVSAESLPEGDGYNIVVQIKDSPSGAFQNFRVPYQLAICGECNRAEYACICDHAGSAE
jgi:hypothetical protein